MREWIDELSDYMENQEKVLPPLSELSEEAHKAAVEIDVLLQASHQLQSAYTSLLEKMDHVSS